jgi:murein DD-endopeptidase MepM/ murein hydrolase activator NlpD
VNRLLPVVLITTFLAAACGQAPSLWGTYATPTAELFDPTSVIPGGGTESSSSTPAPLPTSTFTLTPTLTVLQPSTPASQSPVETTLTPTFDVPSVLYYSQSGDALPSLAARFNVSPADIRADMPLPASGLINSGTLLVIPDRINDKTTPNLQLLPDSEVVFSATAADFDIAGYIRGTDGYLSHYREYLGTAGWTDGAAAIKRLSYENSINPRILLALLDYESRWVRGQPIDPLHSSYPMGYENLYYKGLFIQMVWALNQLSNGYYGWRAGTLTELKFPDGTKLRIDPRLNAGTVAIQYLFSKLHSQSQWAQIIDPSNGFVALYTQMFGDPWARGDTVNPIFPPGLIQPELVLPFQPKVEWSFTGGPHGAWEHDGSLAAIDFAPATDHGGCDLTPTWVTAAAPGLIVRSENGVVVEDLDGDGFEQTGWNLLYLHIGALDRVPVGTWVETDDHIGHASCEGGIATGTHLHFVRKYNGEWVAADGPIPFVLGGWTVHQGALPYEGMMTKGDKKIIADPVGQAKSIIFREPND